VKTSRPVRGWWWPPLAAALLLTAPLPPALIDAVYSRGFYRWGQSILTTVSNITPWTWLDVLATGVLVLFVRRLAMLIRSARGGAWAAAAGEGARRMLRFAGVALLAFLLCWGLNYRRTPLMTALAPSGPAAGTVDDLRQLAIDASSLAGRTRLPARRQLLGYSEIADILPAPFNQALARLGRPRLAVTGRPKYTMFTPFFTRAGVTGMVDPFALESLVHPDLLPFERPFVLAHEWGHLAGLADEAEASALGWSACMGGSDPLVYSASMYLLVETSSALPPRVWQDVLAHTDPGVRDDLDALARRLKLIQPTVQKTSFAVYDRYLKANSVEDGVRSYSRSLQLILLPVLRDQLIGLRSGPADPVRRP
jgi:hypothetical protein